MYVTTFALTEQNAYSAKSILDELDRWDGADDDLDADDPFEAYLSAPRLKDCRDPIAYWHAQHSSGVAPKPLVKMALDYLGAPGTSLLF